MSALAPLEAGALSEEKPMANVITMSARARDRVGKGAARAVRREGFVPAVIYGGKQPPLSIAIDPKALNRELDKGTLFTGLLDLQVEGTKHRVLARDVQYHPVTDRPLHADFLRVSERTRIDVAVPVEFTNEETCPGLKRGGTLNIVRHEVEVSCLASAIPQAIVVDLNGLDIGDSIHISHVNLDDGVEPTITDRDFTIATIAAPTVALDRDEDEGEGEAAEDSDGKETGEDA